MMTDQDIKRLQAANLTPAAIRALRDPNACAISDFAALMENPDAGDWIAPNFANFTFYTTAAGLAVLAANGGDA